jgi:hypothetical protein
MKLTEAQAKTRGMVSDGKGGWTTKVATDFVESTRQVRNAPPQLTMREQRLGLSRPSHEQNLASLREAVIRTGLSEAEADQFLKLGE